MVLAVGNGRHQRLRRGTGLGGDRAGIGVAGGMVGAVGDLEWYLQGGLGDTKDFGGVPALEGSAWRVE
jgi:hypothetical protein